MLRLSRMRNHATQRGCRRKRLQRQDQHQQHQQESAESGIHAGSVVKKGNTPKRPAVSCTGSRPAGRATSAACAARSAPRRA
jgi:hypothetical protein